MSVMRVMWIQVAVVPLVLLIGGRRGTKALRGREVRRARRETELKLEVAEAVLADEPLAWRFAGILALRFGVPIEEILKEANEALAQYASNTMHRPELLTAMKAEEFALISMRSPTPTSTTLLPVHNCDPAH